MKHIPSLLLLSLPCTAATCAPGASDRLNEAGPELLDQGIGIATDIATNNWIGAAMKIFGIGSTLFGVAYGTNKVKQKVQNSEPGKFFGPTNKQKEKSSNDKES